jgi:hypothetical protein
VRILDEAMTAAESFWPEATATALVSTDLGNLQLYIARDEESLEMISSKATEHFWDASVG